MEFRILGPLRVRHAESEVELGGPRQRAVLAALLLCPNEPVRAEQLRESVWESPPASPASNLRTYVTGLRRRFREAGECRDRLISRNGAYILVAGEAELDLLLFENLADRGERALHDGDLVAAGRNFGRALDLWRGRPLEDQVVTPGLHVELARLEDRRVSVLEWQARVRVELGEGAAVIGPLRRIVGEYPFREELWAQLMLALWQSGRQAEALESFAAVRRRLIEELGLEPGPRLRDLHEWLLSGDGAPAPFALPS